jgi:hypothetical protein
MRIECFMEYLIFQKESESKMEETYTRQEVLDLLQGLITSF